MKRPVPTPDLMFPAPHRSVWPLEFSAIYPIHSWQGMNARDQHRAEILRQERPYPYEENTA